VASVIALFNNKGGVSKTTTCFNLGWMLAERGHRVVMVDADPQCNLTGMVLDLSKADALEDYYTQHPGGNLKEALEPAFRSRPQALAPVDCVAIDGPPGLYLIPGHVELAEDEVSLGIAQQLSESVQALRNLPGSFHHLFQLTAATYGADYVLLDLSSGLGAVNQNLVATADYFLVPTSPDIFSVMAINSLARVLPQWAMWAKRAADIPALSEADYPFPHPRLKFLGVIVQRYRLRSGAPTQGFERYFTQLAESISTNLRPALQQAGLLLPQDLYQEADLDNGIWLASIPDFNTLIADSQKARKPVFTLTQEDVRRVGSVWDQTAPKIEEFRQTFERLAERIEALTITKD